MFKRIQVNTGLFYREAGAALAAVTISTAGAIPTASAAPSWSDWWQRSSVHLHEMQDSFEDASIAAETFDLPGLHDACERLHDAVTGLSADMPSPDPALTVPLQAAIDDYHASTEYCDAAVHDMSPSELQQAATYMNQGTVHMEQVMAVLENEPI